MVNNNELYRWGNGRNRLSSIIPSKNGVFPLFGDKMSQQTRCTIRNISHQPPTINLLDF